MVTIEQVVIGSVIGELIKLIFEGGKKAAAFDNIKRFKSILELIKPTIHKIKQSSGEGDNQKLIQLFEDGEKLIEKYSKAHWLLRELTYANKFAALYKSLLDFFQVLMPLQQSMIDQGILELLQSHLKSGTGGVSGQIRSLGAGFSSVSDEIGHLGPCCAPKPPDFMVGLDVPLEEVKKRLFNDDASGIVVSAPGGCGKTTLVKKLCQDPEVKEKFKDSIFYVTVSKRHNIIPMIGKLLDHIGSPAYEFQTDEEAINRLGQLLEALKRPILLVLDDVWREPEFPLQKFEFKIPKYRILVTSRYKLLNFGPPYKLEVLKHKDAVRLFRHSAGLKDEDFLLDKDLDADVNKMVKRCGGFPLALEVIARSLHAEPVLILKSTLIEWSKGASIFDSGQGLLDCIQLSLKSLEGLNGKLKECFKECFMDLGSFPDDQKIPVSALIDMWAELYKLDKNGIEALSILHELSSRNLLNLVVTRKNATEVEGCYDDAYVSQHDVLRDLAIRQSSQESMEGRNKLILDLSGNKLPDWWTREEQPCIKAQLLSISTDEMFSSKWCNMQVPEVEVLILNFQTRENNYTLPEFMKQMDKLKVLVLTNYGSSIPELTNFSVLCSLSSLKRIRLERVSIPTVVELKNLGKITFVMCKMNQAFNIRAVQVPDMLPCLTEINIDSCNDLVGIPEWLCDLVHLRKLNISNCHKPSALPEGIGRLENLKVLRIHACTKLAKLPDSIGSLRELAFLDISGCVQMRKLPKQMGKLCKLRQLYMRRCSSLRELPPSIMDLKQLTIISDTETAELWQDYNLDNLIIEETATNLDWLY